MKIRILIVAALCAVLGSQANAQTPTAGACAAKGLGALQPTWVPKTTAQPTGGIVEVVGKPSIPLIVAKPTAAEVKAGVAPDALRFCFKTTGLRGGEQLVLVLDGNDLKTRTTPCVYETGEPYSFRNAGTPPRVLATIEPRISPVGSTSRICTMTVDGADSPPVVEPPPVLPPVVEPPVTPSTGTWSPLAAEWRSFNAYGRVRFGAGSTWWEKQIDGYAYCYATDFGAPATPDGVTRACEILQ